MQIRRTLTVIGAGVLAVGVVTMTPGEASGQTDPACGQPYAPLAVARTYPEQETLPTVDAVVVSEAFDPSQAPVDMDGDGPDDTQLIDPFTNDVRITRGDGVLDLDAGGADFVATDGVSDLDGDGRDELAVQVTGGTAPGSYIVPGATPVGAVVLADVAVRVRDSVGEAFGLPTTPEGGRLLLVTLDGGGRAQTEILFGPAVLAAGPGGDASTVDGPAHPGVPTAHADLGGPQEALVVVDEQADRSEVTVVGDGETLVFTTAPEDFVASYTGGPGSTEVLSGADGVFLTLSNSDRSGAVAWMWSFSRPCGPLVARTETTAPVATTTPTAAPAQPVATDARFTG